eukprot:3860271-Rhodomonas_salina.1
MLDVHASASLLHARRVDHAEKHEVCSSSPVVEEECGGLVPREISSGDLGGQNQQYPSSGHHN